MKHFRPTALLATLALSGLMATAAQAADTLRIALPGPTTGPVAQYGSMVREGAFTAIEQINAAGGVNGQQLEGVVIDDACEPKQGPPTAPSTRTSTSWWVTSARVPPLPRPPSTMKKAC